MDFVNLDEMMATKKRNVHLFGTDNFRSWMLYFVPGDGTDMHYHANPETFLVLSGSGVVKGIKGEERNDSKERGGLFRGQRLLPDHEYWDRTFGAVW